MERRIFYSLVGALCISTLAFSQERTWKPELMPREREIASALAAGPAAIREAAGVYVLTATGFELVRNSSNGFHCLVERSQTEAFEPQCFDAEGSDTLLQQVLLRGDLRMRGMSEEELERRVAAAWARGSLRAPSRPGINYMLSEQNRVPVGPDQVISYRPHVMFYVPYLTSADVGGDFRGGSPIFVINEGQPSAYAIVPVPADGNVEVEPMSQKERDRQIEYVEFAATDIAVTKEFYSAVFGWSFVDWGPEYSSFEDSGLKGGFFKADEVSTGGALVVIYASDLEAAEAAVVQHGGSIVKPVFSFPGGRRFHFTDPSGNRLAVWSE